MAVGSLGFPPYDDFGEALFCGLKIRCAEACAARSASSGVIPESVEARSSGFLGDPLTAEFKEVSCAWARHGCSSSCVMKVSMADGRYQAAPRLPRTQLMVPVLRAASSLDGDRAGQRLSTSASASNGSRTAAPAVASCSKTFASEHGAASSSQQHRRRC